MVKLESYLEIEAADGVDESSTSSTPAAADDDENDIDGESEDDEDDEDDDEVAPLTDKKKAPYPSRRSGGRKSSSRTTTKTASATPNRYQYMGTLLIFCMVLAMLSYDYVLGDASIFGGIASNSSSKKNSQGPWPECLWMTGVECAKFIRAQVPKDVEVKFMHKHAVDEMITRFDPNRVIIVVNDFDAVQEAPARG